MVILNNMKNILKNSFRVMFILVLSTFATSVASAKTISSNNEFISTNNIEYFENVYKRSNYKHYVLASEYISSGSYSYTTYYYLCLTNENVDISDIKNIDVTCDKMYRYYRYDNKYTIEEVNDNNLVVENSIYYTDNIYDNDYLLLKMVAGIGVGIFAFYLSYVLFKMYRS